MENELIGNIVPDNLSDVKRSSAYNRVVAKDVIHISEAEAASDFAALMASMRAGAKVIIENVSGPVAVLHAAEPCAAPSPSASH